MTLRAKSLKEANAIEVPEDYIKINVLSWHKKDTEYYDLCPYVLKTDGNEDDENWSGIIFENYWQSLKVYPYVESIVVKPNVKSNIVWWEYETDRKEIHFEDDNVTDNYFKWRDSIWNCKNPIRYPNGYKNKSKCLFSRVLINGTERGYDYIKARKQIYVKQYMRLIEDMDSYKKLLKLLNKGKNLCIVEVDLPAPGKKGYYGLYANQNLTVEKLKDLIDDPSESFGHGLALALSLLIDMD